MLGQLANQAHLCVCNTQKGHTARHATVSFRRLGSQGATRVVSALPQQHSCLPRQLTCKSKTQTTKRSYAKGVQAASAAQQQFSNRLSGTGAGGALPSTKTYALVLLALSTKSSVYAGFVNWVNTSKPPKYLWRTLAALLMGGQALVRILQGEQMLLHCVLGCHVSVLTAQTSLL